MAARRAHRLTLTFALLLECGRLDLAGRDGGADDAGVEAGAPCFDSPSVLAQSGSPTNVAIEGTTAFWCDSDGLHTTPTRGGPSTLLLGTCGPFVVDTDDVYCLVPNTTNLQTALVKLPLAGGATTTLASSLPPPSNIVMDATDVYVASQGGWIGVVSKTGGSMSTFVTSAGARIAGIDDANLYWASAGGVHGSPTATINATSKSSAQTTQLASFDGYTRAFALDAANLYFTTYDPSTLVEALSKMSKTGGPITTLATGVRGGIVLAVDDRAAYTDIQGGIFAVPLSGGVPTPTPAVTLIEVLSLAQDDAHLYVGSVEEVGGELTRACKVAPPIDP
jgi:hypothetical protein